MAGLLDTLFGQDPSGPQSQAMGQMINGLLAGNFRGGLLGANQVFANEPERKRQAQLQQMQMERGLLDLNRAKRDDSMEMQISEAAKSAYRSPEMARTQNGLNMGPQLDGSALPHVNPGFDSQAFIEKMYGINPMKAVDFEQRITKDNSPFTVAPGASLVDRKTMKPVFTAPKEQKLPSSVEEYNYAKGQGYGGTYEQWQMQQKKAGATTVSVNTGQKGLENELKIRGEFKSEPIYKAHQEVESAYRQISSSLKMASPAGDLAGATKIMKILDPGSVVRESELGMAMKASGALDRLQNYADNIIKGTKLTPDQRKDFQALADQLYGESVKQYNTKRGEYAGFARDYKLNPDRILGAAITSPKLPTTPAGKPAPGAGARFLGFE